MVSVKCASQTTAVENAPELSPVSRETCFLNFYCVTIEDSIGHSACY